MSNFSGLGALWRGKQEGKCGGMPGLQIGSNGALIGAVKREKSRRGRNGCGEFIARDLRPEVDDGDVIPGVMCGARLAVSAKEKKWKLGAAGE